MIPKRIFQFIMLLAILALSLASTGGASAGGANCDPYVGVQAGDTWSSIASTCGVTVEALQAANPAVGATLSAGNVLKIPTGTAPSVTPAPTGSTYVVQAGDTLEGIALRYGTTAAAILAVNPQIPSSTSALSAGQVINLPLSTGTASTSSRFGYLTVTYGHGVLVRTGPGISNSEIKSPFVSAVKFSHWAYRKDSVTTDPIGFVWVEVALSPLVNGYTTGWILVRDSLGTYFTNPNLGPKISPNDP